MRSSRLITFICAALFIFLSWSFFSDGGNRPYAFPGTDFFPPMPVSPSNSVTEKGAELGRYLFYDPILSADSSISCASCHRQQYAFSDSPNLYSRGVGQALQTRNTPALFNLAWYSRLFWDGRASSLEEQAFHPVRNANEMKLRWSEAEKKIRRSKFYRKKFREAFGKKEIDSTAIANALAQFERTLISAGSRFDKALRKEARLTQDELEGYELVNDMTKGNCLHCHTTDGNALGTTGLFSNNGLDEIKASGSFADRGRGAVTGNSTEEGCFKIPSFRNLLFTAPYMHDGRFKTLEGVLDFYSEGLKYSPTLDARMEFVHKGGSRLTREEKRKIIAFLKTMSDSAFIMSPAFGNPFAGGMKGDRVKR